MSSELPFDPFQVFEVSHSQCVTLHVKVIRGRSITKGWAKDLVDTPDPYLILTLAHSPQSWRKTTVKDNDINPVWEESFTFWLDQGQEHTLEMSLMDANYTVDEHLASRSLPLKPLPIGTRLKYTINFNETSEIDIEIWGEVNENPDLRYSLTLCKDEKKFLEARKRKIHTMMKEYFGFSAPRNYNEVPVVGIIGSGGGFRAMMAYSGAISALSDLGVLDMATYVAGLSGSAWYVSQLYSHPRWPDISPGEQRDEIKQNIDHSFLWLFKSHGLTFARQVWKKRSRGEPVSFTDLFGHLVGNTLIKDRLETRLSDQRHVVNDGQCPLPLYTCLHVKKCVSAMIFHEWMEFSPFEVGLPKYGTFINSEQFACKFFMGSIVRKFPEPPLHFLQGIWGSAFCIQFKRLLQDDKNVNNIELMRREREELVDELEKDIKSCDMEESESSDDEDINEKGTHGEKTTGGLERHRSNSTKMKQKTFWDSMLTRMLKSSWLQSIELRAAQVFNFMRGLSLNNVFPFSPFTQTQEEEDENNKATFGGIFDLHPTHIKKLYVVDSGLTFNSPFPVVLRPQRGVDVILSFDFSARPSDDTPPLKELLLAAKWAELNKVPFPPIDPMVVQKEGLKECYVFKHPWDPNCPIVLHFPLVNINFKRETRPGTARTTKEEKEFGNFSLFDDPAHPYSTFKFTYSNLEFDRITQLMEYNTLLCKDIIYDNISTCIKRRRRFSIRRPCKQKDIARLSLNSRIKAEKLTEYIKMVETLNTMNGGPDNEAGRDGHGTGRLKSLSSGTDHITGRIKSLNQGSRPVSSPLDLEGLSEKDKANDIDDDSEGDDDVIKNTKLHRATVSLKAKMLKDRSKKRDRCLSNMDQVEEEWEEDGGGMSGNTDCSSNPPQVSSSMKPRSSSDCSAIKQLDRHNTQTCSNNACSNNACSNDNAPSTQAIKGTEPNPSKNKQDDNNLKMAASSESSSGASNSSAIDTNGQNGSHDDNTATSHSATSGKTNPPRADNSLDMKPLVEWIDSEHRVTNL